MLDLANLHPYQLRAVNHQIEQPRNFLWLFLGAGKTVITETTIAHLIRHGAMRAALVVGPKRVIQSVWEQEAKKWRHLHHLRFSVIQGSPSQRMRALAKPADIYLINYEQLRWLSTQLQHYCIRRNTLLPFDMLVLDESTRMKNHDTSRMEAIIPLLPYFIYRTGLTGTPVSNGLVDLFGQFLVVDNGERLGTSYSDYLQHYFRPGTRNRYKDEVTPEGERAIHQRVSDIVLEMNQEDYLRLPDLIINDLYVDLPTSVRAQYEELEMQLFTELDNGVELEVKDEAAKVNKLLQVSNGAAYVNTETREWQAVHDAKLDALESIIEEAAGEPILLAYNFRPDAHRIMERFKFAKNITGMSGTEFVKTLEEWKLGRVPLLIGHPACLHPDTEVLTENRGWVRLIDVGAGERVHDGVEFVQHSGCQYSGYREVIEVFGITMTPGHKLLVGDEWVEAKDVGDSEDVRREARYRPRKTNDSSGSRLRTLWVPPSDALAERGETQPTRQGALRKLHRRFVSPDDQQSNLPDLERYGESRTRRLRFRELLRSWDRCVQALGIVPKLLRGYVGRLLRRIDLRANRQRQGLLQGELSLGYQLGAAVEQAQQPQGGLPRGGDASRRAGTPERGKQNDVADASESRNVSGRSCGRRPTLPVWEESGPEECRAPRKAPVYDLVDCGPRHRFLIRNSSGEVFISHNSMGHGVDGLQRRGRIMVWFGLNWSLELYLQFNARLHRQGQGHPVVCHRILARDTADDLVAMALAEKHQTQETLRRAVDAYRKRKEGRS